jgi:cyclopropane fatty-acyl-phospholipid synthase-like methyltransferase
MRDTLYWENYYKSALITDNPSPFAKWVLRNQLRENMDLIELGCGNGRDSLFFAKNGVRVLAVDQCAEEI